MPIKIVPKTEEEKSMAMMQAGLGIMGSKKGKEKEKEKEKEKREAEDEIKRETRGMKKGGKVESKLMKKEGRGMAKATMQKVASKVVRGHEKRMHKMKSGGSIDGIALRGHTVGRTV
jgi:hypothetical protein